MRPPEFTGGNAAAAYWWETGRMASMRPPEFTGGNTRARGQAIGRCSCFNEAAGIHRRKRFIPR